MRKVGGVGDMKGTELRDEWAREVDQNRCTHTRTEALTRVRVLLIYNCMSANEFCTETRRTEYILLLIH